MTEETLAGGTLANLTPEEAARLIRDHDAVLIDVRTPQEFALERIRGALLAPMQDFEPGLMPCPEGKTVVLHCGSGKRSRMVAERCLKEGALDRIAHIEGGFGAWKEAGLPYIGTDPATGGPKEMNAD